ncbi:hypothetical protein OHA25_02525 [Nonomuraea sp. NBC_00507]
MAGVEGHGGGCSGSERTAFDAVKTLIKVAIVAAIIFWVAANINRFM